MRKNGERNKMDELFLKTFNHYYAYALYRVYDKTRAEDAVMGMYENVLKYIDSYNPDKGDVGWMFKILNRVIYNLNSDELDKNKHEQAIEDDINATQLNDLYETIGLEDAVSGLSDRDKLIVVLYYFERVTLNEIANKVKLSSSAAHKRLQQILKN